LDSREFDDATTVRTLIDSKRLEKIEAEETPAADKPARPGRGG
jgi:hypothetical protein